MSNYREYITFKARLAGKEFQVVSKPGLANFDQITPATHLITEHVQPSDHKRVLLIGTHHGAAAVSLAQQNPSGEIWLTDPNIVALNCSRQTFAANLITPNQISESISLLPEHRGQFDTVIIEAPKGRQLTRRWLLEAYQLLRLGGTAYLAGSNDLGIKSHIQDAEQLFGKFNILDYKKGSRIARFVKNMQGVSLPDWAFDPGITPGTWMKFPLQFDGQVLTIYTLPGVFSYGGLDAGTALLLENIKLPEGSRFLDVGCGCGIIGMALATRLQKAGRSFTIDMVDSDLLAVASAHENCQKLHLADLQVIPSDLLEAINDRQYDFVVSNPPFHTGKEVNYTVTEALIQQSYQALTRGGKLVLVANRFIRYDRILEKFFTKVSYLAQDKRFHLIEAQK